MSRPSSKALRRTIVAGGVLAGLAIPSAASAADSSAVVLTTDNKISTFETAYPTEATTPVAVTGLTAGDRLIAIDSRPQNGYLYALGRNATAGTLQLYGLSSLSAVATPIGAPIAAGGNEAATEFGFDFNPTVDRIRVTSDAGVNLRLNPNDGTVAATDPAINGGTTKLDGVAYTNNEQNATATTLYGLDASSSKIYRSTNANLGTYAAGRPITVGGVAATFSAIGGFDIAAGTDVTTTNDEAAAGKVGFAAVKVGTANFLVGIELATGNAAPIGFIGDGTTAVQGLAIQQETAAGGLPAITSSATQLRRFNTAATSLPDAPAAGTSAPIVKAPAAGGIDADETLVGIDYRPSNGQLIGLGVNAAADTATLYRIDPQTGAATALSAANGAITFTTDGVAKVDLPDPATAGYDIDFNPTVDRVRVVTSTGLNFRANPLTGGPVDGDNGAVIAPAGTDLPVAGTNPDGNQNAASADLGTDVSGTGYTNSFAPATGSVFTTQYGISAGKDQLLIQNPPNKGTQTQAKAITAGGSALDVTSVRGFDVPRSVRVTASNTPATGTALAILGTGTAASTGLYSIDLATGGATLKAAVAGTASFAVGDGPPPAKTRTPPTTPPVTPGTNPPVILPPTTPTTPVKPPVIVPPATLATFGKSTKLTVKLRSTRSKRNGPAKVTFRNTNNFSVKVRLQATTPKSGKRKAIKYSTKTYTVKKSSSRTINLRLPSAARKVLQSKKKLTIKVTLRVTDPAKKNRTVRKTLTLRLSR
jgi:hypothetical protein